MSREALLEQVVTRVTSRARDLETFLSTSLAGQHRVLSAARRLIDAMEDEREASDAAYTLLRGMYGSDDPPREFWATAAGRAIARAIGFHRAVVPYMTAAAILGVSRQRVYQLAEEGRLQRAPNGDGVTAYSLRRYLSATA